MKLFKKSTMSLALTAAMIGGVVATTQQASAVNIAQDGLGQALVFPYYNTRDGWTTLFTLTNTSNTTVVAKVRWREGVNSRDARDFNIILSPYDVWTAGTRSTGEGAGMFTPDNSCTFPKLPALPNIGTTSVTGIDFTNLAYSAFGTQDNRDKGSTSLDRTKEGYFEVIEMGSITPTFNGNGDIVRGAGNADGVAYYSKHNAVGDNAAVPRNCDTVRSYFRGTQEAITVGELEPPLNVLKGEAVLVKGAAGIAAGYNPLTLANFSAAPIYFAPDAPEPSLANADPFAVVIDDSTGLGNAVGTTTGQDAVTALISRDAVINNYNVDGNSATSWVMSFPTKNFYVDRALFANNVHAPIPLGTAGAPFAPFDTASVSGEAFGLAYNAPNGKSCFDVNFNIWDREEFDTPPEEIEDEFSPREPGAQTNQNELCYETNIVSFGDDNDGKGLFSSELAKNIPDSVLPGQFGWAKMTFGADGAQPLPVVGMKVEIRNRGDASVNYGFANDHAYTRPAPAPAPQ